MLGRWISTSLLPQLGWTALPDVVGSQVDSLRWMRTPLAARTYAEILAAAGAPDWQRHLADAHGNWRVGWLAAASGSLGSGVLELPDYLDDAYFCWDLEFIMGLAENLRPDLVENLASLLRGAGACQGQAAARLRG